MSHGSFTHSRQLMLKCLSSGSPPSIYDLGVFNLLMSLANPMTGIWTGNTNLLPDTDKAKLQQSLRKLENATLIKKLNFEKGSRKFYSLVINRFEYLLSSEEKQEVMNLLGLDTVDCSQFDLGLRLTPSRTTTEANIPYHWIWISRSDFITFSDGENHIFDTFHQIKTAMQKCDIVIREEGLEFTASQDKITPQKLSKKCGFITFFGLKENGSSAFLYLTDSNGSGNTIKSALNELVFKRLIKERIREEFTFFENSFAADDQSSMTETEQLVCLVLDKKHINEVPVILQNQIQDSVREILKAEHWEEIKAIISWAKDSWWFQTGAIAKAREPFVSLNNNLEKISRDYFKHIMGKQANEQKKTQAEKKQQSQKPREEMSDLEIALEGIKI